MDPKMMRGLVFVTDEGDGGGSGNDSQERGESTQERTFTQAELDAKVRERLTREKSKYADYDSLKEAAAELARIRDEQKTEEQRQREALETARREAETARLEAARFRAAAEHGITGKYASLLSGGDADELNQNAELLGELITAQAELERVTANAAFAGQGRPAGTKPGAAPVESTGQPSPADEARLAAERRGRLVQTTN